MTHVSLATIFTWQIEGRSRFSFLWLLASFSMTDAEGHRVPGQTRVCPQGLLLCWVDLGVCVTKSQHLTYSLKQKISRVEEEGADDDVGVKVK